MTKPISLAELLNLPSVGFGDVSRPSTFPPAPLTREESEQFLRAVLGPDYSSDTPSTALVPTVEETDEATDDKGCGCPPGVCMGDVNKLILEEATALGISPSDDAFGDVIKRVFERETGQTVNVIRAGSIGQDPEEVIKQAFRDAFSAEATSTYGAIGLDDGSDDFSDPKHDFSGPFDLDDQDDEDFEFEARDVAVSLSAAIENISALAKSIYGA